MVEYLAISCRKAPRCARAAKQKPAYLLLMRESEWCSGIRFMGFAQLVTLGQVINLKLAKIMKFFI